ncbi:toprim domain-containing protein [Methylicorpusculum oleiharenae]|uniref:toprim domain-containing protein n=1 Tax=Methylicorpusculum oleiharenae TaxID=1338687 RepID=UPI00135C546A|nr:toprim domain-containing protein [Methylicorpusculum oleiharenae]MCD2449724.1 toprim domain-containing protein [Methylicorpusculum oleiharenae]
MNSFIHGDIIEQFKNAMQEFGIEPPTNIVADGNLHRFKIDSKLNGAYVLHLDSKPAGFFQDFKTGVKQTWKAAGGYMPLSEFQKQQLTKKRLIDEQSRQALEVSKHRDAAIKANTIWQSAPAATASKTYLVKKQIQPHSARLGRDNTLIIPIYAPNKSLVNLQFISPTGGKRFLAGGRKKGCFAVIRGTAERILICEGWATGASLNESTGHQVFIALDAGNLAPVAVEIRKLFPDSEIVICGDNDLSGVGQKAAHDAALACNGLYLLPDTAGHDFNDEINAGRI